MRVLILCMLVACGPSWERKCIDLGGTPERLNCHDEQDITTECGMYDDQMNCMMWTTSSRIHEVCDDVCTLPQR